MHLHHKLKEAEERKNSLLEEERTRSTPAQEREQLLQRVKDDNAEMATMERQIGEIQELIHKKQQDLEQTEQVHLECLHATISQLWSWFVVGIITLSTLCIRGQEQFVKPHLYILVTSV